MRELVVSLVKRSSPAIWGVFGAGNYRQWRRSSPVMTPEPLRNCSGWATGQRAQEAGRKGINVDPLARILGVDGPVGQEAGQPSSKIGERCGSEERHACQWTFCGPKRAKIA